MTMSVMGYASSIVSTFRSYGAKLLDEAHEEEVKTWLASFIELVREEEREACAKLASSFSLQLDGQTHPHVSHADALSHATAQTIASEIRARGDKQAVKAWGLTEPSGPIPNVGSGGPCDLRPSPDRMDHVLELMVELLERKLKKLLEQRP